jgi:hypothetical protein
VVVVVVVGLGEEEEEEEEEEGVVGVVVVGVVVEEAEGEDEEGKSIDRNIERKENKQRIKVNFIRLKKSYTCINRCFFFFLLLFPYTYM